MPNAVKQTELSQIIERLQNAVNRYDGLTCEVRNKLQRIKKFEEPFILTEAEKEKQPDSVVEEINRLLNTFQQYNDRMEYCLRHLNNIV